MVMSLKKKFQTPGTLWVSFHEEVSDFYASSWQRGDWPVPMLIARLILAVTALSAFIWSVIESTDPYWFIFLTNWGLLLVTLMTLNGLFVSFMAATGKIKDGGKLPWYISMYWLLYNIVGTIAILITSLYWVLLYDADEAAANGPRMFGLDVMTHAINSCIVVIEILLSRTPVRILHFYQPLGVGLWYAAFSVIYYLSGGTDRAGNPYVYSVLDWTNKNEAGTIIGISTVGTIAIYLVIWLIALLRDNISSKLRTTSHELPMTVDPQTRVRVM